LYYEILVISGVHYMEQVFYSYTIGFVYILWGLLLTDGLIPAAQFSNTVSNILTIVEPVSRGDSVVQRAAFLQPH